MLHSRIVEEKNEFLKKLCVIVSKRILSTFLVLKTKVRGGTILENYLDWLFFKDCKKEQFSEPSPKLQRL